MNEEVTLTQFRTLVVLSTRGPQTVTALAESLDVHTSTMTRMCTRLVAANWFFECRHKLIDAKS